LGEGTLTKLGIHVCDLNKLLDWSEQRRIRTGWHF